jgi:hypothetical protein
MIRYALSCKAGHRFESWFQSGDAFDTLVKAGHVACPLCGETSIEKALMAPAVAQPGAAEEKPDLTRPASEVEAALAAMRRHVEENSDYVGLNFVAEARKMYAGEVPERSIYGEARPAEARALLEEGVPVAPLPFVPPRKAN